MKKSLFKQMDGTYTQVKITYFLTSQSSKKKINLWEYGDNDTQCI